MKKLLVKLSGLFLIVSIILLAVFSAGCKKPTGTLHLDNYTPYSMNVSVNGKNCNVGPYGYSSYTIESGTYTASAYTSFGSFWASCSVTIPEDGSVTLYIYMKKSGEIKLDAKLGKEKPADMEIPAEKN